MSIISVLEFQAFNHKDRKDTAHRYQQRMEDREKPVDGNATETQ